jgi:hypothetical protein
MSANTHEFSQRIRARIDDMERASSSLDGRLPGAVDTALAAARDAFAAIDEFMRSPHAGEP